MGRLAARRASLYSLSLYTHTEEKRETGRRGKALNCRGCSPAGFGGFAGSGCCGLLPVLPIWSGVNEQLIPRLGESRSRREALLSIDFEKSSERCRKKDREG